MDVAELISSVGFPIVMCLILVYRMKEQEKDYRDQETRFQQMIDNNTNALNNLSDVIKHLKEVKNEE